MFQALLARLPKISAPAQRTAAKDENCILANGRRACVKIQPCAIGRPFLVEEVPRLACAIATSSWSSESPLEPWAPEALRKDLAKWWTDVALMEHASVAAFARFTLQLLALGAPAELVSGSGQAMQDEIKHAELGFALASFYAGHAVGPGHLSMDSALDAENSLADVVRMVFREGCVGETTAALEAEETAANVRDEKLSAALQGIARDEKDHATLAWRFVRWALEQQPQTVKNIITDELARARDAMHANPKSDSSPRTRELLEFGRPSPQLRGEIRRRALKEIVEPCAHQLIAELSAQVA